ncbi:hypothetical protein NLJ89_g11363 [Agrocybe chaxingu]|uniref:Uncharacterized protein n=1 Tax=Agrocybe chaxingu TaxID=84603 RepID=A0A9W8JWX6_9AGAR|nr:hypothetical protein NLJ89_g11363 [Agrocybe chaxingu]
MRDDADKRRGGSSFIGVRGSANGRVWASTSHGARFHPKHIKATGLTFVFHHPLPFPLPPSSPTLFSPFHPPPLSIPSLAVKLVVDTDRIEVACARHQYRVVSYKRQLPSGSRESSRKQAAHSASLSDLRRPLDVDLCLPSLFADRPTSPFARHNAMCRGFHNELAVYPRRYRQSTRQCCRIWLRPMLGLNAAANVEEEEWFVGTVLLEGKNNDVHLNEYG